MAQLNLLKNCEIQVEFSRVKKSEDLTEGFNLSRGKGKLSDPALHYIAYRLLDMLPAAGDGDSDSSVVSNRLLPAFCC